MNNSKDMFFYFFQNTPPFCKERDVNDNSIKLANPDMSGTISAIDPIELKYALSSQIPLPLSARSIAAEFEDKFQYSSITKREYSYILENLRLVYGNEGDIVRDDITLFHKVETKLICKYFGIPQLNQMFDEDYFQFEWDMHVGQNYIDHTSDYYRDHFIHQIRNLHMMLTLLERFGFREACDMIFRDRSASRVSKFVYKKHLDFCDDPCGQQQQLLKKLFAHYKESISLNESEYIEAYFYKYVIYASIMLSALFHDMGYPICHFLGVRQRLSEYNPAMYMFTHNAVDSFDPLAFKLGSSLLFSIVSPAVIRKRLEPNNKGKYDHGAYSAIAFLLEFYETGIIYSLSAEKQCAIELAALAMFNHTSKFKAINPKDDTKYYNMFFQQNPISFILRFCDDLQEWDRRYFEITMTGDLIFCPTCGFPFMKHKRIPNNPNNDFYPVLDYECGCSSGRRNKMSRPEIFIRRKMYLVTVADWVKLTPNYLTAEEGGKPTHEELIAEIHYDLYKLLILSKANCTYAKHRLKELGELSKLLEHQEFNSVTDNKLSFFRIRLKYFMSANPLLIKIKMLELFLDIYHLVPKANSQNDGLSEDIKKRILGLVLPTINTSVNQQRQPNESDTALPCDHSFKALRQFLNGTHYEGGAGETVVTIKGALDFYYLLLRDCLSEAKKESAEVLNYINPYITKDPMYYETMKALIGDCLNQYSIHNDMVGGKIEKTHSAALYQCITRYTNYQNGFNNYSILVAPQSPPYIGYFKDIYFFYRVYELTMKKTRESNTSELKNAFSTVNRT